MVFYEKRFPDDIDLLAQFLDIVLFVYKSVLFRHLSRVAFTFSCIDMHVCTHAHASTYTHTHRSDTLSSTELTVKLEPAFLCGLRCPQVEIRSKFFEVYNASVQKRLFDRLLYMVCSQNWEHCGGYFWIKHCIEVRMCGSHYITLFAVLLGKLLYNYKLDLKST